MPLIKLLHYIKSFDYQNKTKFIWNKTTDNWTYITLKILMTNKLKYQNTTFTLSIFIYIYINIMLIKHVWFVKLKLQYLY